MAKKVASRKFVEVKLDGLKVVKSRELPQNEVIEIFKKAELLNKYTRKEFEEAVADDAEHRIKYERDDPKTARERAERDWKPYLEGVYEPFIEDSGFSVMELITDNGDSNQVVYLLHQVTDGHSELRIVREVK